MPNFRWNCTLLEWYMAIGNAQIAPRNSHRYQKGTWKHSSYKVMFIIKQNRLDSHWAIHGNSHIVPRSKVMYIRIYPT